MTILIIICILEYLAIITLAGIIIYPEKEQKKEIRRNKMKMTQVEAYINYIDTLNNLELIKELVDNYKINKKSWKSRLLEDEFTKRFNEYSK